MINFHTNSTGSISSGTPRWLRAATTAVFILVLTTMMITVPRAEAEDDTHDLIRAAMVYNFCKFVQWPEKDHPQRLVLGVLGGEFDQPDFSSINGKAIKNKPLEVRDITSRQELAECNLVYIAESQNLNLTDAFAESRNESILTISEIDDFCVQGGIIQMVPRRGKMRFFINRQAADESGLTLSSQLLKMARIVEGE